jgi:peptidoglycan/LPS O-acetylase OafA/YrhL
MLARPNLRSLDALRGLLAGYVLFGHARWLLWAGQSAWAQATHPLWANVLAYAGASLRYGHEAVMVFFVLSGYFIHLRTAQGLARGKPIQLEVRDYARRRIHRLLAPYLFALGLTVACDLAGRYWFPTLYLGRTGDAFLDGNFLRKDFSWAAVLPAGIGLPGALGKDFGSNGPLWSLAYEVVYYALYPLWLLARRTSPSLAYGVVPVGCFGVALVPGAWWPLAVLAHYPLWLAGAALAEWMTRGGTSGRSRLLAALLASGGSVAYQIVSLPLVQLWLALGYGVGLVWLFALLPEGWARAGWHRVLEFLGIRGYTIYICHFPVLVLLSAALFQTAGGRPMSGWLAVGGGVLTLGVCLGAFQLCERHFLHARIRLAPGRDNAGGAP